jgi:hypothetical protein
MLTLRIKIKQRTRSEKITRIKCEQVNDFQNLNNASDPGHRLKMMFCNRAETPGGAS